MQKTLGAVLGVVIVAAVLGGIVFRYAEPPAETPVVSADNGKTVKKQKLIEPEPAEPEPVSEPGPVTAADADGAAGDARPAADPSLDPVPGTDPGPEPESDPAPKPDPAIEPEPEPDAGREPVTPPPVSLYIFWGPFDLEGSARGFGDRIAELTGLTIDVVEKTAGEYMVAFQYRTEAEKERAIETIEKEARLKIRPEETP